MKTYLLFAGVNGAGKSTLYQTMKEEIADMPRVNTDEIIKGLGDWRDFRNVISAGKIAVKQIETYFEQGITFNQETTLCGASIIKNIHRAKELGYYVIVHYVGVETVDIAKERIRKRVQDGGHGIPDKDVERRYAESFRGLNSIFPVCDEIILYDNTDSFRRFAVFMNGNMSWSIEQKPAWYSYVIGK